MSFLSSVGPPMGPMGVGSYAYEGYHHGRQPHHPSLVQYHSPGGSQSTHEPHWSDVVAGHGGQPLPSGAPISSGGLSHNTPNSLTAQSEDALPSILTRPQLSLVSQLQETADRMSSLNAGSDTPTSASAGSGTGSGNRSQGTTVEFVREGGPDGTRTTRITRGGGGEGTEESDESNGNPEERLTIEDMLELDGTDRSRQRLTSGISLLDLLKAFNIKDEATQKPFGTVENSDARVSDAVPWYRNWYRTKIPKEHRRAWDGWETRYKKLVKAKIQEHHEREAIRQHNIRYGMEDDSDLGSRTQSQGSSRPASTSQQASTLQPSTQPTLSNSQAGTLYNASQAQGQSNPLTGLLDPTPAHNFGPLTTSVSQPTAEYKNPGFDYANVTIDKDTGQPIFHFYPRADFKGKSGPMVQRYNHNGSLMQASCSYSAEETPRGQEDYTHLRAVINHGGPSTMSAAAPMISGAMVGTNGTGMAQQSDGSIPLQDYPHLRNTVNPGKRYLRNDPVGQWWRRQKLQSASEWSRESEWKAVDTLAKTGVREWASLGQSLPERSEAFGRRMDLQRLWEVAMSKKFDVNGKEASELGCHAAELAHEGRHWTTIGPEMTAIAKKFYHRTALSSGEQARRARARAEAPSTFFPSTRTGPICGTNFDETYFKDMNQSEATLASEWTNSRYRKMTSAEQRTFYDLDNEIRRDTTAWSRLIKPGILEDLNDLKAADCRMKMFRNARQHIASTVNTTEAQNTTLDKIAMVAVDDMCINPTVRHEPVHRKVEDLLKSNGFTKKTAPTAWRSLLGGFFG